MAKKNVVPDSSELHFYESSRLENANGEVLERNYMGQWCTDLPIEGCHAHDHYEHEMTYGRSADSSTVFPPPWGWRAVQESFVESPEHRRKPGEN